jgi:hypothetical protein
MWGIDLKAALVFLEHHHMDTLQFSFADHLIFVGIIVCFYIPHPMPHQ